MTRFWNFKKHFYCRLSIHESSSENFKKYNIREIRVLEVRVLHSYCEDKIKSRLLSSQLFQRKQEHVGWEEPEDNDKLF